MNKTNKKAWGLNSIVDEFTNRNFLLKAEQTIIKLLKDKLKNMFMLDIGVGAGRTTPFFAPLVKDYMGIDYIPKMIKTCKRRFPKYYFLVDDVRNLEFTNACLDFILFSWNGIDYISKKDREKAFKEMYRVLKIGGYLFFSTHNYDYLKNQMPYSLLLASGNIDNIIINDGVHGGKFKTYYANPGLQVLKLEHYGFSDIQVFSHETGKRVLDRFPNDYCLHYLCKR